MIEYPVTKSIRVAACYADIARTESNWNDMCDDPMSKYAPMEDFHEDYDRKLRKKVCMLHTVAREERDPVAEEFAMDLLERWMP